MTSFRQISAQFPALVIDAGSSEIQVGRLEPEGISHWYSSGEESGVAVFQGVRKLEVDPNRISAFVFCDGPGSVLGIRTVAMALRTWCVLRPRPTYAYCSLALVAHARGKDNIGVISDARRDTWHHYRIGDGLRRVATQDLAGELVMPQNFRHWSLLPPNVGSVPYALADLIPKVWDDDLLLRTESPDAFLHEEPGYVTWTPKIHRATGAR